MIEALYKRVLVCCVAILAGGRPANAATIIPQDALRYGETIWIQNGGHYRRYLKGMQGNLKNHPKTHNPFEEEEDDSYFKWVILQPTVDGGIAAPEECIRFGDVVMIKNPMTTPDATKPYLLVGDNDEKTNLYNGGWVDDGNQQQMPYQFVIRSTAGSGKPTETSDDPAYGLCVLDTSVVYIQSAYADYRWLEGALDGSNTAVHMNDVYDGDEFDVPWKFHWILRTHKGHGNTSEGFQPKCLPTGVVRGVWNPIATAPTTEVEYTTTYVEGIARTSNDDNEEDDYPTSDTKWNEIVTDYVSTHFVFGEQELQPDSPSIGELHAVVVADALELVGIDIMHTRTWYEEEQQGGVIWQYTIHVEDLCSTIDSDGGWDVTTNQVYLTPSLEEPPCCIPGFFVNDEIPHGSCLVDSPCQCSPEICNNNNNNSQQQQQQSDEGEDEDEE